MFTGRIRRPFAGLKFGASSSPLLLQSWDWLLKEFG